MLLLAALAIEALWPARRSPGALSAAVQFGRLGRWLEQRLNRAQRSDQKRLARGVLAVAFLVAIALAAGFLTHSLRAVPFGWIAYLFVLVGALSLRQALDDARAIDAGLRTGAGAMQHAAAHVFGPGAEAMGEPAIARRTGGHLATHLVEGVVAPVFWFFLLGPAGMLTYVAIAAAADLWPDHAARHQKFGLAVSSLRVSLRWIPDWIAALLLAAGALPQFRPSRGTRTAAALFGALNITVDTETLRPAGSRAASPKWHGDASAVLRAAARSDVRRAAYLTGVSCLVGVSVLRLVALVQFAA